ncbi:MAG: radical SAM protein [Desulfobacteraceae bacterium]|jgi:histone acetyltransferase (RNA polymerase elongator complex component)
MQKIRKPFIVPVFIPHEGCPHRCIFCDQSAITGKAGHVPSRESLKEYIDGYLKYAGPDRYPVQISFYGGTFLGLENETIIRLLSLASVYVEQGRAHGIRFSTRPDSVTKEKLDLIQPFPVRTVELGVQSMDDTVLALSNRGHLASHTEAAATLLVQRGYEMGLQIMTGLPGDDLQKSQKTVERLSRLKPAFLRIYPVLVLKGSALARLFLNGQYAPIELHEAVDQVKRLYLYLKGKNIPVIRMGLQASEELDNGSVVLAGPYHPSFGHLVFSAIFFDMAVKMLQKETIQGENKQAVFYVHSKNISKLRGLKNNNLDVLKALFHLDSIRVVPDDSLDMEIFKTVNDSMTMTDLMADQIQVI